MTRLKSDIKTKHVAGVGSVNLTEDEIEAIWSEQQAKEAEVVELSKTQYRRDRVKGSLKDGGKDVTGREIMVLDKPGYASIGDQLDQLFWDIDAGKLDKTGEFYKAIKAVKDAHSKPE
tara:strand:- start:1117 stop:1470 length:354 start_codon:yes stop_codon:yes gene_type:complete